MDHAAKFTHANLHFDYLPVYAQHLIDHRLADYAKALLKHSREMNVPLLRYFEGVPDEKLIAMGIESNRQMLTLIVQNKANEIIENSTKNWVANQVPGIERDQVVAEDITLINFVRRKVLRDLLAEYTQDVILFTKIMEEVDEFTMCLDTTLFKTFIHLQQAKINSINVSLQRRETELLEAQRIGQIGSFEWIFSGTGSVYTPQIYTILEIEQTGSMESFMNDVHPDDKEKLSKAIKKAFEDGDYSCEYRYIRNSKEKVIQSRGKVFFEDSKPVKMTGTMMDVTERSKIIERLQQSEDLYKQAQSLTHIGNWSWDIHQDQVSWSDEMYRIYGLEPQSEIISLERFMSFVHPDDKENRLKEIQEAMQTLIVKEYYFRIIAKDGQIKVLRGRGGIIADNNRKPIRLVGTCQDITKEYFLNKELQEREEHTARLNASLEQKNQELQVKNQELESFNFIASHDLQEPLRKIQLYSNRIMENATGTVPVSIKNYSEKMFSAADRMQKLIDDFLSFSKTISSHQSFERIDLDKVMDDIKLEMAGLIDEKQAAVHTDPLPTIAGIPFQIRQLLINLIGNSLKYSKQDIPPHITIRYSSIAGSESENEEASPEKQYHRISITDNGIGFEQKFDKKIFELFQRLHTKENFSGTGIGLAICKKVVDNHQGFITVASTPDQGSSFHVYLPIAEAVE